MKKPAQNTTQLDQEFKKIKDILPAGRQDLPPEAPPDDYSILHIVPFLITISIQAIIFIPSFIFRGLLLIVLSVSEISLVITYAIIILLRGLGRMVILIPFGITYLLISFLIDLITLPRWIKSGMKTVIKSLSRLWKHSTNTTQDALATSRNLLSPDNSVDRLFALPAAMRDGVRELDAQLFSRWSNTVVSTQVNTVSSTKQWIQRYKSVRQHYFRQLIGLGAGIAMVAGLAGLFYTEIWQDMPNPSNLRKIQISSSTRIMDRNGNLLYKVYRNENRTLVKLSDLPPSVIQATVAVEDSEFFKHKGISLRGTFRAFFSNVLHKGEGKVQGGSTITQQLVKNLYFSYTRDYRRKIREGILALFMETYYTKAEILQMYLNEVAYGGPAAGIAEASSYYFGKSPNNLTVSEAALLAGLPSEPSNSSPFVSMEAAKTRQAFVLKRMVDNNFITGEQMNAALNEKLVFVPRATPILAPHFVMMIRSALIDKYGQKMVESGGLNVYTTLDLDVQRMAEKAVKNNIDSLGRAYHVNNGAAIITKPQTGEVLALVGSYDYFNEEIKGNVNVVTSQRQPGSSVKTINYGYAFDHGLLRPGSIVVDSPVVYQIPGSVAYAPVNYDGKFKGAMTVRSALAESRNLPAVKTLAMYGPKKMIEFGRSMGITTWAPDAPYGLSLTLGSGEVKMIDMATVYGTIANMGVRRDPILIRKIVDSRGNILVDNTAKHNFWSGIIKPVEAGDEASLMAGQGEGVRVMGKVAAYWLIDILSDNKARLPAFGPYAKLEVPGHHVAVKTGTTNDVKDNWTMGFTPDYLVATWVGNTDNSPMNKHLVSGITGAAPMWNEMMTNLLKDVPDRVWAAPTDLVPVQICATNGMLTCANCPRTVTEYFVKGQEPKQACSFESADVCSAKKAQAESENKSPDEMKTLMANCALQPSPTQ